jgi:serine/threonine protein kinase
MFELDRFDQLDAPTPVQSSEGLSSRPPSRSGDESPLAPHAWVGDHEILSELARGGMGVVYRARQHSLNRFVALKMILDDRLALPGASQILLEEAQAAASLDHPGIVPVYEVGQYQGKPYFTMALVEGSSLALTLAKGPLAPKTAADISRQVADAIAYAHRQQIMHLDIKPANVMLDTSNRVRVTDFGVARRIDSLRAPEERLIGTPQYMPPEQADPDGKMGTWSDIYAIGALLYACVTGRPPHWAATAAEVVCQVLHHEPVLPRRLNPAVPPDLEAIIVQAMSKQPHLRYGSAEELSEDLSRFLNELPVRARSPHGWHWVRSQARKHLVLASVSGFAALLLMGLTLTITMAFLQTRWELMELQKDAEELRQTLDAERRLMRTRLLQEASA